MANSTQYKDLRFAVGDTIRMNYRIKEDNKERLQLFEGIVIKVKGFTPETKTMTVRKMTRSGIGVERIVALSSPYIQDIKVVRKSNFAKAKLYFVRNLSDQQLRTKLYHKASETPAKKTLKKKAASPKKTTSATKKK